MLLPHPCPIRGRRILAQYSPSPRKASAASPGVGPKPSPRGLPQRGASAGLGALLCGGGLGSLQGGRDRSEAPGRAGLAPLFPRKGRWREVSHRPSHTDRGRDRGRALSEPRSGSCGPSRCEEQSWGRGGHTGPARGHLPRGPAPRGAVLEHLSLHQPNLSLTLRSLELPAPRWGGARGSGGSVSAQGRAQKGSPFAGLRTQRHPPPSFPEGETEARGGRGRPEPAGTCQAAWPLSSCTCARAP